MKVGIVGFGDGGQCNLNGMLAAGAKVTAICDTDPKILAQAESRFKGRIRLYDNIHGLLADDVELIVIATPDHDHLESTELAAHFDKHVFVEKPAATNIEDLATLKMLVQKFHGRLHFSEKYSFAGPVQAAWRDRKALGRFNCGDTKYMMWKCDRIMGDGKWRTESRYNPCAGGLSHNFMTALLFVESPIVRVRATGRVLTYHENLDYHGGYDTMEGTLQYANGVMLGWLVCLATKSADSPYAHRTVIHTFQFANGSLAYGPTPESDQLIVNERRISMTPEPGVASWSAYNQHLLYERMHADILAAIRGEKAPLHTMDQGINVALACTLAFESAQKDGSWIDLPDLT